MASDEERPNWQWNERLGFHGELRRTLATPTRKATDPYRLADLIRAGAEYLAANGHPARFVIVDAATFSHLFMSTDPEVRKVIMETAHAMIAGMHVVVIDTDGLPMLRAAGAPLHDAGVILGRALITAKEKQGG